MSPAKLAGQLLCAVLRMGCMAVVGLLCIVSLAQAQWRAQRADVIDDLSSGGVNWSAGMVWSQARAEVGRRAGPVATQRTTVFASAVQATQQNLLEILMRLPLDAERTVGDVLQGLPEKRRGIEELVAEAEVVQARYLPQDVVETTLQLPVSGPFTSLVWPAPAVTTVPAGTVPEGAYTGIVIDARGLGIRRALFPKIVDEAGRQIYAPVRVSRDIASQRGYMVYVKTLDHAQVEARAGEHPLVIRAQRVVGPARIDLLIRRADAASLADSAITRMLLERCQIVIVG